jgi:uncharacterized repeat protein (TIGR03803 family)
VVFKVDCFGKETVLYTFTGGPDGNSPFAAVARDIEGNLYGTTYEGGSSGLGVVFKLDSTGKRACFAVDPFVWTGFSVFKWERLFS